MKKKRIKRLGLPWLLLPGWLICSSFLFKMRESDRAAIAEFAKKGVRLTLKTMEIDGIKLHYAKTGNDSLPTLFFIHGSPGSWTAYKRYLMDTALLQHFRMIAIDRPGFGYSSFGHAFHLYEQSALIYHVVEQEDNGKPLHLIGHSLGGPIVVKLAQEHPNAYASLTILSGSISPYDEPKEKWRGFFASGPLQYVFPGANHFIPWEHFDIIKKHLLTLHSQY